MKRSVIRLIVALSSILLIGLVSLQAVLVSKAYDLQVKQFNHDVTFSLKNVVQQIALHNNDSTPIIDPVKLVSDNLYIVSINDTLHPYYLESLLKNEFRKQEIDVFFEYAIYDCFTDSVVYRGVTSSSKEELGTSEKPPAIDWDKDGHYFGVYFPSIREQVFNNMRAWFVTTALLFLVVIFFAYAIMVILKQKRLSEVKTDFINNMTHELKTPISTISLSAEVLMKPDIAQNPERLKNYAQIIYNENNRLKNQVERVLQAATLEKEEIKLKQEVVDIHSVIEHALMSFHLNLESRQAEVKSMFDAQKSKVFGDDMHLTNVFINLIDNAIKYTVKKPELIIKTYNEGNEMVVEISDNGIGISKENQKHIFQKFYRVPTGNVHDTKGFGLGLNYVKVLTEAHKGSISVKSELNSGSTFIVRLPLMNN